jgi:hypothetical protein
MLALRRQKALQAAIDGLCAGTKVKPGDVQGGLQVLFQAQALLAQDVNKGRASTEAMRLILQVLGLFAKNSEAGDGSATATLSLSREALQDLAQLLLRHGSNGDK